MGLSKTDHGAALFAQWAQATWDDRFMTPRELEVQGSLIAIRTTLAVLRSGS